jgi:hypothetical protein
MVVDLEDPWIFAEGRDAVAPHPAQLRRVHTEGHEAGQVVGVELVDALKQAYPDAAGRAAARLHRYAASRVARSTMSTISPMTADTS